MRALLLTREDGRALLVELCDTVEHMRAKERGGLYQAQVAEFAASLWTGRREFATPPSPRAGDAARSCCGAQRECALQEARMPMRRRSVPRQLDVAARFGAACSAPAAGV
jgi:hypothetical protein